MDETTHLDPFERHFQNDLPEDMLKIVSSENITFQIKEEEWPSLNSILMRMPDFDVKSNKHEVGNFAPLSSKKTFVATPTFTTRHPAFDFENMCIKSQIRNNVLKSNKNMNGGTVSITELQLELLSIMTDYKDLYFTKRNFDNAEEVRFTYALHSLNHILKTRLKILHHNSRINEKGNADLSSDNYRDQGLTRPKILILVPFRDSAYRVINIISSLLLGNENPNIIHKKRFLEEFKDGEISTSQKLSKPKDYGDIFQGNIDDNFKIGITITKNSLKLYADFYSSDIIVASPLGLRMILGAEGEADRDYDFLSSIELLIIDQAEIFLMQNWDHLLHVMDHLNLQPKDSHGTDFSRVRSWTINGLARYYRQTLVFASYDLPQISAILNRRCRNYEGSVRTRNITAIGTISHIVIRVRQIFHKISGTSATDTIEKRFNMFTEKILVECQDNRANHVLIYVPSYFDFIRLRNYMKSEIISFVQISEYSKKGKVAEARDKFFHTEANFMLYSERFHFYNRKKIRGIRHIIFYQLPTFPNYYAEFCNFLQEASKNDTCVEDVSVTALYSKHDAPQLAAIVNSQRASRMLSSDKSAHMFITDE